MQPNTMVQVVTLIENNKTLLLQQGEFIANVENLPLGSVLRIDLSQAEVEIKGTIFTVTET